MDTRVSAHKVESTLSDDPVQISDNLAGFNKRQASRHEHNASCSA
jgi:hypothetical protein